MARPMDEILCGNGDMQPNETVKSNSNSVNLDIETYTANYRAVKLASSGWILRRRSLWIHAS